MNKDEKNYWKSDGTCFVCGRVLRDHSRREFNRCMDEPLPIVVRDQRRPER